MEILKSVQLLVETMVLGAERAASKVGTMAGAYMKGLVGLFMFVTVVPIPMLLVGIFGGMPWVTATAGLWWCFWTILLFATAAPIGLLIELLTGGSAGTGERYVRHAAGVLVTGLCFALFTAVIPIHEHLTMLPVLLLAALILAFLGSSLFSRSLIMFVVTLILFGLLFSIFFPLTAQEVTDKAKGLDGLFRDRVRGVQISMLEQKSQIQPTGNVSPAFSPDVRQAAPEPATTVAATYKQTEPSSEVQQNTQQEPGTTDPTAQVSATATAASVRVENGTDTNQAPSQPEREALPETSATAVPAVAVAVPTESPPSPANRAESDPGLSPTAPESRDAWVPPAAAPSAEKGPTLVHFPSRMIFAMNSDWPSLVLDTVEIDDSGMLHLLFNVSNPGNNMVTMVLVDPWRSTFLRINEGQILPLVRTLGIASNYELPLRPGRHELVTLIFAAPQQRLESVHVVTRWSSRGCPSPGTRAFEKRISVKTQKL